MRSTRSFWSRARSRFRRGLLDLHPACRRKGTLECHFSKWEPESTDPWALWVGSRKSTVIIDELEEQQSSLQRNMSYLAQTIFPQLSSTYPQSSHLLLLLCFIHLLTKLQIRCGSATVCDHDGHRPCPQGADTGMDHCIWTLILTSCPFLQTKSFRIRHRTPTPK